MSPPGPGHGITPIAPFYLVTPFLSHLIRSKHLAWHLKGHLGRPHRTREPRFESWLCFQSQLLAETHTERQQASAPGLGPLNGVPRPWVLVTHMGDSNGARLTASGWPSPGSTNIRGLNLQMKHLFLACPTLQEHMCILRASGALGLSTYPHHRRQQAQHSLRKHPPFSSREPGAASSWPQST